MSNSISFFVSSTFKDMQGERDSLHRYVIPSIREFASNYGRNVDFIDLRWGISTDDLDSDVSTDKILNVCLDEIEQCSPYQIVILGERYGWIPSAQILKNTADKKNFNLDGDSISVTELEIQYGLWLNQNQLDKCIFCLRKTSNIDCLTEQERNLYISTDNQDIEKMHMLKNKIMNTPGVHIVHYELDFHKRANLYEDFVDKLNHEIRNILTSTWGERSNISWLEHELDMELMISNQLNERFSARENVLRDIQDRLCKNVLILYGDNGCGQTSIMARLGKLLKDQGSIVKNIYCGHGYCADTEQLLKIMVSQFIDTSTEEEFQKVQPGFGDIDVWKEKWDDIATSYKGEKVYLLIDGIHHLSPDYALSNSYFLPSKKLSSDIVLVISKNSDMSLDPIAIEKTDANCHYFNINECNQEDLKRIISSRLKAEHKQIGEYVMQTLLSHPMIHNMLCMELILQDILNLDYVDFQTIHKLEETMSGNDAISKYLCDIIKQHPNSQESLINFWIERSLNILAEHDNDEYNYLYYMMACMTLSKNGLSVQELSDMADYIKRSGRAEGKIWNNWWADVRFSKFRRYMGNLLIQTSDGRYKFAHEQIRSALFSQPIMCKLVAGPMVYFQSLPDESELKQDNLLASYLLYISDTDVKNNFENNMDTYFFSHIENAFALINDGDNENLKIGNRRINRMLQGIRTLFLYGCGEFKVKGLCKLIISKTKNGISIKEPVIDGFLYRLSLILKDRSVYEKSIMLACYISVGMGYEEWEGDCGKPERGKRKHNIGIYKNWTEKERRLFTRIYAEICDYYHEVSCYLDTSERTMSIPWDWNKIRNMAGLYIDVFEVISIFRGKYCNKIVLIDADNNLKDNYRYSFKLIEDSKDFNKSILHRAYKDQDKVNKITIEYYLNCMLNTAESYLKLASYIQGKESEKIIHNLYFEANYACNHAFRQLKKKKLINGHYDLEPALRLRYMKIRNYTEFYYDENKQNKVDDMWELYQNTMYHEFLHNRACRDEILSIAMIMMEYVLMGYMPTSYKEKGKSLGDFAYLLARYEESYMSARGYSYHYVENIYMVNLLRAMYIVLYKESNMAIAKAECEVSLEAMKTYLDTWHDRSNDYIMKFRRLYQWHEEFLKNC